jgi:hypothetical protein
VDEATLKRLVAGGVIDVEGVLEITARKLAEIVGDTALATRLRERAKAVLANTPAPSTSPAVSTGGSVRPTVAVQPAAVVAVKRSTRAGSAKASPAPSKKKGRKG